MTKSNLPTIAKEALESILQQNGEVIYSSHETLKKVIFILWGSTLAGLVL